MAYGSVPTSLPPTAISDDSADLTDILSRHIGWEQFHTAHLITQADLQALMRYDKRSTEMQTTLLDQAGRAHVEAFLAVLRGVTKEEVVQYVEALLLQMLAVDPGRAKLFHPDGDTPKPGADAASVFLRLLQRQDWFTQEKAAKLLTAVIQSRPKKSSAFADGVLAGEASTSHAPNGGLADPSEQAISSFIDWLCGQLRRPTNPSKSVPTAVGALSTLLREKGSRVLFTRAGGVQLLAPLLRTCNSPTNSQLLYEICLCLWQLSYYKPAADLMATAGIVKGLVDVAKSAQKEKVFRIALASLRNLLDSEGLGLAADMVDAGLPKVIVTRSLQSWDDTDIADLLTYMDEKLKTNIVELSSFDKYKKEVLGGSLDWTPMHTSDIFWRQNIDKFEDKDFQVLRVLLKLLEASRENRTLAVGCNDLGKFIEFHPHGRFIVSDLRGKELVMRLMMHPDPEVQKRALLCVQKIMLPKDKLDFLQASTG